MSRSSPETETDTDQALVLLVDRFAKRLLAKLRLAHANGRHGWEKDDWEVHCQQGLLRHLEKGDPRDVAAYCAFMDHHGWVTVAPQPAGHAQTPAPPLRMCGLCGTWNSKPCGNQCGLQVTDPTFEQMAFTNAAEAAALADTSTDREGK